MEQQGIHGRADARPPAGKPYVGARSKRKARRHKRLTGFVVMVFGLTFLAGSVALAGKVLAGRQTTPDAAPSVAQSQPVVQPMEKDEPEAEQAFVPVVPAATGPHDVSGVPPLYNRDNPIPQSKHGDNITLASAGGGYKMEPEAADAFLAMCDAAREDGVTLAPVSGYRSNAHQTSNYNNALARNKGIYGSEEEALRQTELYYAIPGTSEHEAGLAMDIGSVEDSFANTPAYRWLQEHCWEYGFIYRYPQGTRSDGKSYTDELTYIAWEPWHYRFVGANHAQELRRLSNLLPYEDDLLTLEEYTAWLNGEEVSILSGISNDLLSGKLKAEPYPSQDASGSESASGSSSGSESESTSQTSK